MELSKGTVLMRVLEAREIELVSGGGNYEMWTSSGVSSGPDTTITIDGKSPIATAEFGSTSGGAATNASGGTAKGESGGGAAKTPDPYNAPANAPTTGCVAGIVGGVISNAKGGIGGVLLGIVGGGLAGGCFTDRSNR